MLKLAIKSMPRIKLFTAFFICLASTNPCFTQTFNHITDPHFDNINCNNNGPNSLTVGFPDWYFIGIFDDYDLFGFCEGHRQKTDPHPRIPSPLQGNYFGSHFGLSSAPSALGDPAVSYLNELVAPLEANKYYYFKIHNMLAPWSTFTLDKFMFIGVKDLEEFNSNSGGFTGLEPHTMIYRHPEGQFLSTTSTDWERFESCFQARGGEYRMVFVVQPAHIESPGNPHQRLNPDVDYMAGGLEPHRRTSSPQGGLAFFWDDAAIIEIPEELSYEVEFCDNDEIRLLDSTQIEWPDVVTMKGATYRWDDGVRTLERSLAGRNEHHLRAILPCTEISITIQVSERACQELIYIPNAFTPNRDGVNDLFKPEGSLFEVISLEIYDRYGSILHRAFGPDASWDGTTRGLDVQPGTYIYLLRYRTEYGTEEYASGDLLLYR